MAQPLPAVWSGYGGEWCESHTSDQDRCDGVLVVGGGGNHPAGVSVGGTIEPCVMFAFVFRFVSATSRPLHSGTVNSMLLHRLGYSFLFGT
jgi:hypothetical protein